MSLKPNQPSVTTNSVLPLGGWPKFSLELLFVLALAASVLPFLFTNGSLDGDGLEYLMLYRDLFRDGFSFGNWSPPPGRGIELVVVLDFLLFFLSGENLVLTSYLSALAKCLCLYGSIRYLFHIVVKPSQSQSLLFALALTVLLSWSFYLFATTYVFFTNSNNLKQLLYLVLGNLILSRLLRIQQYNRVRDYVALFVLTTVGAVGTAKFTAFVALPCLVTWNAVCGVALWKKKPHVGRLVASALVFLASFLVGYLVLFPASFPKYYLLQTYSPKSFKDISVTFSNLIVLIQTGLRGDLLLVSFLLAQVLMVLFLSFRAVVLWRRMWAQKSLDMTLLMRAYITGLALSALVVVVSANLLLSKGNVSRYYTYIPYYLWLATLFELFEVSHYFLSRITKKALVSASVVVCGALIVLYGVALPHLKQANVSLQKMLALSPEAGDSQGLTRCLARNKERYKLAYGLAEYWTARPIHMMSKGRIRVYQINPKLLSFYHWNNNVGYYWEGSQKLGVPFYNFIIVGYQEIHDEFARFLRVQPDNAFKRSIQQRLEALKRKGLSDVLALKQVATNSRNVEESRVRNVFGPPSATFVCKLISGDVRKVLVYHRSTAFDTRIKERFYKHYRYLVKVRKYPFKLNPPRLK